MTILTCCPSTREERGTTSGAATSTTPPRGLTVFAADRASGPRQQGSPHSKSRNWTRQGLAEWLRDCLLEDVPTVVSIDHAFLSDRSSEGGASQTLPQRIGPAQAGKARKVVVIRVNLGLVLDREGGEVDICCKAS